MIALYPNNLESWPPGGFKAPKIDSREGVGSFQSRLAANFRGCLGIWFCGLLLLLSACSGEKRGQTYPEQSLEVETRSNEATHMSAARKPVQGLIALNDARLL